jgi:NAD(P)-dependent dehydrogenase (short-subunit alcohol dehydrogenase family)
MTGYSSMKAGVIGLVKGIGKEYAQTGITVNGLAPAVIKTAMNEKTAPEQLAYMTAKIPMVAWVRLKKLLPYLAGSYLKKQVLIQDLFLISPVAEPLTDRIQFCLSQIINVIPALNSSIFSGEV